MSDTTDDATDADRAETTLDGLALDEAVDRVAARPEAPDRERVRAALAHVADDGVVTDEAAASALAEVSKFVATAETRTELAGIALADAREAADPVADLPTVAARLERFERAVASVEERADALGSDLQSVTGADPEATFALADGIRRVEERSREIQRTADELQVDLEEFERWLDSHPTRVRELRADIDALADSLGDLESAAERLDAGDGPSGDDPARAWFDATLRHRALGISVADLRADLADLGTWTDREDVEPPEDGGLDGLAARLDDLADRHEALGERLDRLARPAWTDRFGDRVAAVESDLDALEPPVDWGAVQETLEAQRPESDA